jgi:hypothetical protein
MRINLVKRPDGSFIPAYNSDKEKCDKMKPATYAFSWQRERNPKHHALVFAMARCTLENMEGAWNRAYMNDKNNTPYEFLKAIMIEIGQVEVSMRLDGTPRPMVKSLKWEQMNETEFQPISDAIAEKCAEVLGVDIDDFNRNYKEYL